MTFNHYFHSPNLHKNSLIVLSEDDIWITQLNNHTCHRLTIDLGKISNAQFSPDGKHIAFSATSEGSEEVYIIATAGGLAKRLTFLGQRAHVRRWKDLQTIVFSSTHQSPFNSSQLYEIDITGSQPKPLEYGPAKDIDFGPESGDVVIGTNGYGYQENTISFMRYRGGLTGNILIKHGDKTFQHLLEKDANLIAPTWHKDRIYFLSDYQDHGNIYSCHTSGKDLIRHTHHEDFYVRSFCLYNEDIIYAQQGNIYHLNLKTEKTAVLPLQKQSSQPHQNRQFAHPSIHLEAAALSEDGEYIALSNRGRLFFMPSWQGGSQHLSSTSYKRFKEIDFLGKDQLIASADHGKKDVLHLFDRQAPYRETTLETFDLGRVEHMRASPDGAKVAISNHRHQLLVIDIKKNRIVTVEHSPYNNLSNFDWSNDSCWLVYSCSNSHDTATLKLYDIAKRKKHTITTGQYADYCPIFDPSGRFIYFLSQRNIHAKMDELTFQYGYQNTSKIYCISLQKENPNPFLHTQDNSATDATLSTDKSDKKSKKTADRMIIDTENIQTRLSAFPLPPGRYTQLLATDKKLFVLNKSSSGTHKDPQGKLSAYDFKEQTFETFVEDISSASLSPDRKWLLYYYDHKLRAVETCSKPNDHDDSYKKGGYINLKRCNISIEPEEEWRFIFTEAWRLQQDYYWDKNMGGIDWNAIYEKYRPIAEKVGSRTELNAIISEMQGELGCSHAYTWGGNLPKTKIYTQGHLGCETTYHAKNKHYTITKILESENSAHLYSSPLKSLGANVEEGDAIISINNQKLSKELTPEMLLVNQANCYVTIGIQPKNLKDTVRFIEIKTLATQQPLLYRNWVEKNRRYIEKKTKGRLGYIHIPDMGQEGIAEFTRSFLQSYDCDGLIIDVRFNGGGHTSSLILQKLAIKRFGLDFTRWHGASFSYPHAAPNGAMVAICNEQTGSDGDMFCYAFKQLQLGKLIGRRTWGGVVGISVRNNLLDGGVTTQPEYAVWFDEAGYNIENRGVEPDEEINTFPENHDQNNELDRAIEIALEGLDKQSPLLQERAQRARKPSRKPKKLPKKHQ